MFLDLCSIVNIDQHEINFPMTYNIVIFGKKSFLRNSGRYHGNQQKIVDTFFLKLEPFSFPMMYRYCF